MNEKTVEMSEEELYEYSAVSDKIIIFVILFFLSLGAAILYNIMILFLSGFFLGIAYHHYQRKKNWYFNYSFSSITDKLLEKINEPINEKEMDEMLKEIQRSDKKKNTK